MYCSWWLQRMTNLYKNFFSIVLLDSGHELLQKFRVFLKIICQNYLSIEVMARSFHLRRSKQQIIWPSQLLSVVWDQYRTHSPIAFHCLFPRQWLWASTVNASQTLSWLKWESGNWGSVFRAYFQKFCPSLQLNHVVWISWNKIFKGFGC